MDAALESKLNKSFLASIGDEKIILLNLERLAPPDAVEKVRKNLNSGDGVQYLNPDICLSGSVMADDVAFLWRIIGNVGEYEHVEIMPLIDSCYPTQSRY